MISKLNVFDFDGTLFESPRNTPENLALYERETGIPWVINKVKSKELTAKLGRFVGMRQGWWGRPETLEPPLVPSPAPKEWFKEEVRQAFLNSKEDRESITVIMTGRYRGLRNHVCRVLHEGSLVRFKVNEHEGKTLYDWHDNHVSAYFLGDDGPSHGKNKPSETLPWKLWVIQQFVEVYPGLTEIEIWEDREEHVEKFRELNETLAKSVRVNHVI